MAHFQISSDNATHCLKAGKGFSSYISYVDFTIAPADLFLRLNEPPLHCRFVGLPVLGDPDFGLRCFGICIGEIWLFGWWLGDAFLSIGVLLKTGDSRFLCKLSDSSWYSSFFKHI